MNRTCSWRSGAAFVFVAGLAAVALGEEPAEWKAPAAAATKKSPVPFDATSVAAGRAIFMANCASCHGAAGKGDGPAGAALERKPADLSRPEMSRQTDGELFWKITTGKKPMPEWRALLTADQRWQVVAFLRTFAPGPAAETGPPPTAPEPGTSGPAKPLTPEEQAQLRKDVEQLRQEVAALKGPSEPGEEVSTLSEIEKKARAALDLADSLRIGTTRIFLAGTAHADFTYTLPARNTTARSSSVFGAGLEIDTLWKINEWFAFEGGVDTEISGNGNTDVSLAIANACFFANDYLMLRAGLMPTAFSRFKETLDPPWINKLPDEPLLVALVPDTTVGVEARGALPLGPMRLIYSVYTINDPILNTSDPVQAGTVSFYNFQGFDNVPGFGAKLGLRTTPEFEFGAACLWSMVGSRGTDYRFTDVIEFDLYLRFQQVYTFGTIDLQAEWAWQHIRKATYAGPPDANGVPAFGPLRFTNESQSGYVQLGYRLTAAENVYVKNVEFVARYDWLGLPAYGPPGANMDTNRVSAGVDYWFTPSIVLKAAYEFSEIYAHPGRGKDTESHAFITQLGMGF
jgi:mono/diheme cytochrome c family protein